MAKRRLHIGIVVGEASGDILGAGLMKALQSRADAADIELHFDGIGGPRMIAAGFHSFYPMDRLSVMGFIDPLKRLPELLRMRKHLKQHFRRTLPDVFIGVDSPDFTLNIEADLKQAGIKTAHYVSPSVWAWRQGRIKTIARAVDMMLTLLPFEAAFYEANQVPVRFVGHPLADEFPLEDQRQSARHTLAIDESELVLAVLPGSRGGEVGHLAPAFLDTIDWLHQQLPQLKVLIPAASAERRSQIETLLAGRDTRVTLLDGQSREVMAAADAVLMASGTTTLEAMLLKRPMVVAYRLGSLSYKLLSRLVKTPHISLPNLLAGEALVPEIIQDEVRPDVIGPLLLERLSGGESVDVLKARFRQMHEDIALNASDSAADAILKLAEVNHG
ncbi:lipid-A-disaccharide synthase [Litorivivens lipolytica]|uniref:Lipid-A-disaccharide synthase n=1 Tax=Litorivivens lipolytica TaxID=1524264 RepID=A0A7W4Z5K8_9GAMM|nr:lipid-A-disaccharide synthase [Litorivivens lipolytica]MBB3045935.1 lipid-A-disaccharide synthase [Litorivivens lipolytica]